MILFLLKIKENAVRIFLFFFVFKYNQLTIENLVSLFQSHLSINSTCHRSPFGCCKDNITISPTFDRQGCPGKSLISS